MKRKVIDELIKWKTLDKGKPILLTGVKGVGKTYLAYDFAKAFFEHICYINFDREPNASRLFQSGDLSIVTEALSKHFQLNPEEAKEARVLILDEIGSCREVLTKLSQLPLRSLFRFVIAISSNQITHEFLEGIEQLTIYPLEFDEFLRATSNEWYIESIMTHFQNDRKIPEIVHKELLALHRLYLEIGGMPGVINEYLNLSSTINVPEQHAFLISSYHDTIQKDNIDSEALKMNQVFDSLVHQLMKVNKKFQYKLIRKGTTHAMYKDAIRKLTEHNYIIRCNRSSYEQLLPSDASIQSEEFFLSNEWKSADDNTNFKLYLPDTGILHTKITEVQGSVLNRQLRKTLLENYVAQSLQAKHYPFAFWESDSMAKIDFLFRKEDALFPVEIFESDNTRSKSISVFKQKCVFSYAIKISSRNFEFSNNTKYVPYYAVFCL